MKFLKDINQKRQFVSCFIVFVMNGMIALSIGSMLPFIREQRGLDYAFAGLIVSMHSVGNLISSFFAGTLPAVLGKRKSILLFEACLPISYFLIVVGKHPIALLLAFFMSGLARGANSNFCNTAINELTPSNTAVLNALHAMFSVGAFLFPIFLVVLTASNADNWIYSAYFMVAMGLICLYLYITMPIENDRVEKKKTQGTGSGFLREPSFYLSTLCLFFYLCAEQGVIGWMITYFVDTGLLSQSLSQMMASILWVLILAGRLTTAAFSQKVEKSRLLMVMGAGMAVFFFLLINATSTPLIIVGIVGFGFSMAGVYPTTVSFAGDLIKEYPMAWSFILTFASFGSILMPIIIGKIADMYGIAPGMASVAVVIGIELVVMLIILLYSKKREKCEIR